jgi:glycerol-3-phosphate acyltransferase PlsY
MVDAVLVIIAYLLGSVSSAVLVSKAMGLPDPRTVGSGNPGATNVLRTGGRLAAGLTLLGDMLKGVAPVLVGHLLQRAPVVLALIGLAAFLGHLYPVFFGFKGGKGVATALGVLLGLLWSLGLATLVVWLAVALVFKYSSLAALSAAALAPIFAWLMGFPSEAVGVILVMVALLWWRHRGNVQRLLTGQEDQIGRNTRA